MQSCELEASGEKAAASGDKSDGIMRLAWALVHSHNAPDVQRGIAMLEGMFDFFIYMNAYCLTVWHGSS